jgi:hypothetical protein
MYHSSAFREFLRAAYAAPEALSLYHLHEAFLLSPAQIINIVTKLQTLGWIDINGLEITLTQIGRRNVLKYRREIFLQPGRREWSKVPQTGAIEARSVSTPYLPDWRSVDPQLIRKK